MDNPTLETRTLSILMPTHNRAGILPLVFESLQGIVCPAGWSIEMIVVVNACSDNTAEVLDVELPKLPYAARHVIEPDAGSSHARNRGIREASGEILVFIDDDVLVAPGWLTALVEVFDTTPADFVGGPIELWWHAVERPAWFSHESDSLLAAKNHGPDVIELDNPSAVITINTAYKRHIIDTIGPFRRDLERRGKGTGSMEDVDFNRRALQAGFRLFYAPEATVRHWVEPSRMTLPAMSRMIYYVGQARVFAKPALTLASTARSLFGNLYLLGFHLPAEALTRAGGAPVKAFYHRRKWTIGVGGLVGLGKRLMGRESGYS